VTLSVKEFVKIGEYWVNLCQSRGFTLTPIAQGRVMRQWSDLFSSAILVHQNLL